MYSLRKHRRLVAGALALAWTSSTASAIPIFSGITSLGDSLSDVGRIHGLFGDIYPDTPPDEDRFSNGPVWIEYLAESLHTHLDPQTQYALGGSMTSDMNYQSELLPGFQQQVDEVIADGRWGRVDPRSLYTVWVGANDFFAWLESGETDPTPLITNGVGNTVAGIERLVEKGARRFLVVNVPDLGKTPAAAALTAQYPGIDLVLTQLCMSYNNLLASQLDRLERDRRLRIVRLDSFGLINDMVSNPGGYGFTNVQVPASFLFGAVDPDEFLFWDAVHPTTAAQYAVAEAALAALQDEYRVLRTPAVRARPKLQPSVSHRYLPRPRATLRRSGPRR